VQCERTLVEDNQSSIYSLFYIAAGEFVDLPSNDSTSTNKRPLQCTSYKSTAGITDVRTSLGKHNANILEPLNWHLLDASQLVSVFDMNHSVAQSVVPLPNRSKWSEFGLVLQ
jgi:hypothetical protein